MTLDWSKHGLANPANSLPLVSRRGRGATLSLVAVPEAARDARFLVAHALAMRAWCRLTGTTCIVDLKDFPRAALTPAAVLQVVSMVASSGSAEADGAAHVPVRLRSVEEVQRDTHALLRACLPASGDVDQDTYRVARAMLGCVPTFDQLVRDGADMTWCIRRAPRSAIRSAHVLGSPEHLLELLRVLGRRSWGRVAVDISCIAADEDHLQAALDAMPSLPMHAVVTRCTRDIFGFEAVLRLFVRHMPMSILRIDAVHLIAAALGYEPAAVEHLRYGDPAYRAAVHCAARSAQDGSPARARFRAWIDAAERTDVYEPASPSYSPTSPAYPPVPTDEEIRRNPWVVCDTFIPVISSDWDAALAIARHLSAGHVHTHVSASLLSDSKWLGEASISCGAETAIFAYARVPDWAVPRLFVSRATLRWRLLYHAVVLAIELQRLPYRAHFDCHGRAMLVGRAAKRSRDDAMHMLA
ncbi:hypothetical protein AB1Y20_008562 [Prymnesium parvum]|uniref:Uncharacterized protein n=1 Tax=Prymnesium parvum TaxID=97485 RepID=A0AB34IUA7_PRYPA